ncbi:MAG: DUF4876 domain-containing protein [Pseudobacter sp.]|uniref:DUF4876 domain-containing protein n=1 Tax=Pseudobacter sp. TaxID=2045420 RepID=UPI003F7D9F65
MRFLNYVLGITVTAVLATGCRKDDLQTNVQPINVVIKASFADEIKDYAFPFASIKLLLKNTITGGELTVNTDNNGIGIFSQVASGVYDVTATLTLDKATYENLTGETIDQTEVHINAARTNMTLNPNTNGTIELILEMGRIGDWVFKQIYYAGSNGTNGASFRDQFIEIYNNSNNVLYADSLYFGQLMGNNTKYDNVDLSKTYYVNDATDALHKQFDWSKSIGITPTDPSAYRNYVYMKSLFRIPGTGKQYPVAPGESIIIAATAQNHRAPYAGMDGKPIEVKNPALTVDLHNANFEVYLGDIISNPFNSDVDNGTIPNVKVISTGGNRDLILDATGRDAYVLFKTDKSLPLFGDGATAKGFGYYPDPTVTSVSGSTEFYYQIPNNIIIDAVQIQNPSPTATQRVARKLVNALDAGPTNVPDGQYTSESLIRKTAKTVAGRKILMDTNNSANDFDFFLIAQPGGFKN